MFEVETQLRQPTAIFEQQSDTADRPPPIVRQIQFTYETPDDTKFHVRSTGPEELHRKLVIDELLESTILQVLLSDWIHGTDSNGNPASLLFFNSTNREGIKTDDFNESRLAFASKMKARISSRMTLRLFLYGQRAQIKSTYTTKRLTTS